MSLSLSTGSKAGSLLTNLLQLSVSSQSKISSIVTVILVASSAWIVGQAIWLSFDKDSVVTQWRPMLVSGQQGKSSDMDLNELLNANIFGAYSDKVPKIVTPVVKDAPKTRLNLILVGAVASSNQENSLAVISNRGSQSTYGVGEVIEGTRAKLKAVFFDRVIIDNAGRDETLMLEGVEYKRLTSQDSDSKADSQLNALGVSSNKLEAIRAEIAQDPERLLQYIRLSQTRDKDGKLAGYRVRPGKDRALFEAVGLKNGDIATHLNGEDLTDPATMGKIWQSLSDLTEVNLTVERAGQVEEIYIQF